MIPILTVIDRGICCCASAKQAVRDRLATGFKDPRFKGLQGHFSPSTKSCLLIHGRNLSLNDAGFKQGYAELNRDLYFCSSPDSK
jgi:hypothetical protein